MKADVAVIQQQDGMATEFGNSFLIDNSKSVRLYLKNLPFATEVGSQLQFRW